MPPHRASHAVADHLAHDERGFGAFDALDRENARVGVEEMLSIAARHANQDVDLTAEAMGLDDLRNACEL